MVAEKKPKSRKNAPSKRKPKVPPAVLAIVSANADTAIAGATDAALYVRRTNKVLGSTLHAIKALQRVNGQLSEVVSSLSDLSSQSQFLAINASIEAARAGEHGPGFSIIAAEVRKLSERSEEAVHELARLLNDSTERADEGLSWASQLRELLELVTDSLGNASAKLTTLQNRFAEE